MPWYALTATEFHMHGVDTIRVNDYEVLVPLLEGTTEATWCVAEPHAKTQIVQGPPFKEVAIPFLRTIVN